MTGTIDTIPPLSKILSRSLCSQTDQHPRCQNRHREGCAEARDTEQGSPEGRGQSTPVTSRLGAHRAADTRSCPTGLSIPLSLPRLQPTLHPIPGLPLPSAPRTRTSGSSNSLHLPHHPHCLPTPAISLPGTACPPTPIPRTPHSPVPRHFPAPRPGPAHRSRT